jgi:uncharacterized protein
VEVDPQGGMPGRGAYVHPSSDCLETAQKRRALERALGVAVPEEVWALISGMKA